MEGEGGGPGMRTRSFRGEDYYNRRVFLRSYPLQWEEEERGACQGGEEEEGDQGMRTRSFRDEGYNNRRVFLRSYPLQWEEGDQAGVAVEAASSKMVHLKSKFIAVFQRGEGTVPLIMRRIKDKAASYLVACHPSGFKLLTV